MFRALSMVGFSWLVAAAVSAAASNVLWIAADHPLLTKGGFEAMLALGKPMHRQHQQQQNRQRQKHAAMLQQRFLLV